MTVQDIKDYIDEQKLVVHSLKDDEILMNESIIATLNIIKSMLDQLDWVSIDDERKPKHREGVLVTDDDEVVFDCLYAEDLYEVGENDTGENDFADYKGRSGFYYYEKAIGRFLEIDNVIAWKPLPKPYKRKENK